MAESNLLERIHGPADLKKLPIEQLPELATEIRQTICDQVSRTGGHLASNLCVVDQTIALHYVFDFSHDRLLWDVGHQCYAHKLLTGRRDLFPRLKKRGGMAGFPDPQESPYDLFAVGHAGTSISTAVGMARADTVLGQDDRKVAALIGDASIVNGVAMEGINSAGTLDRQFLVVLNDNGMAIAPPQGALAQYFDRTRVSPLYGQFKKRAHQVLKRLPGSAHIEKLYHRAGEVMKAAICDGHMFEKFGLLCLGPIDGHDIRMLVDIFHELKDFDHPVLLHCKTIKGKGFDFSENDAFKFHSPKPFVVQDCRVEITSSGRSFTRAFAEGMLELMADDPHIFAVTAAMPDGTGVDKLMAQHPDRTLDAGLCESNAMDLCAGMAKSGLKPFFAVYSSFSQRALDQVFQEIALHHLPVRICMDRAGYVGGDGAPMHGFMDIAMYKVFPRSILLAPCDEPTMKAALRFMLGYEDGPSFVRYPRGNVADPPLSQHVPPFELGKAHLVRPSKGDRPHLAILAYGAEVYAAAEAMENLARQGYDIALYDARFAKPVDIDLVERLVGAQIPILTVEDHGLVGGFGTCVLEACNERRIGTQLIHRHGMPHEWMSHDSRDGQLERAHLDAAGIARRVRHVLDEIASTPEKTQIHVKANAPDAALRHGADD